MPRLYLLIAVFSMLSLYARGQLQGRVFEDKTRIPLAAVSIENLNNKHKAVTQNDGRFSIRASVNDLLVLKGFAYQNDTLLVTDLHPKEIFMLPEQHLLKDVKVSTFDGPPIVVYQPNFHGQTVNYQTDKNGNYKGGVTFRFWYWKKAERKRARQQRQEQEAVIQEQIDKTFTEKALSLYIPLSGVEMDNFIFMYKPPVRTYQDNDFNLAAYLNTCYQKFMKLPVEKREEQPAGLNEKDF
jgi:hypothetical protein